MLLVKKLFKFKNLKILNGFNSVDFSYDGDKHEEKKMSVVIFFFQSTSIVKSRRGHKYWPRQVHVKMVLHVVYTFRERVRKRGSQ